MNNLTRTERVIVERFLAGESIFELEIDYSGTDFVENIEKIIRKVFARRYVKIKKKAKHTLCHISSARSG